MHSALKKIIKEGNSPGKYSSGIWNQCFAWCTRYACYVFIEEGKKETLLFMACVCLVSLLLLEFYNLVGLLGNFREHFIQPLPLTNKTSGCLMISKSIALSFIWGPEVSGYRLERAHICSPFISL